MASVVIRVCSDVRGVYVFVVLLSSFTDDQLKAKDIELDKYKKYLNKAKKVNS